MREFVHVHDGHLKSFSNQTKLVCYFASIGVVVVGSEFNNYYFKTIYEQNCNRRHHIPSEGNENKRKFAQKKRRVIGETIKHSQQLKKDSRYIIDVRPDGNVIKGLFDTETSLCVMGKRCRELEEKIGYDIHFTYNTMQADTHIDCWEK
uniref:Uncharacterized protein n=1 Tax=Glossina pallidipes TaxID=7398 RepID=A0A1B0A2S6_GLOPL